MEPIRYLLVKFNNENFQVVARGTCTCIELWWNYNHKQTIIQSWGMVFPSYSASDGKGGFITAGNAEVLQTGIQGTKVINTGEYKYSLHVK